MARANSDARFIRLGSMLGCACALLLACNSPDAVFAAASDAGADGKPGCLGSADCAGDPGGPICDTSRRVCVECLPGPGACQSGAYCAASRQCETGCGEHADCGSGLACDVATHTCTGCTLDEQCPPGTLCNLTLSTCDPGCSPEKACIGSQQCCGAQCTNVLTSPMHCGGCDLACGAGKSCNNGSCSGGSGCPLPFEDCDGAVANGCETNLSTNSERCGSCSKACASSEHCTDGVCSPCPSGTLDCDRNGATGCEISSATDGNNCGACLASCAGDSRCSAGACIACGAGTSDCDKDGANGCECPYPTCDCEGACLTQHNNGLGQSWFDCTAYGTYDLAQAFKACAAYAEANGQPSSKCEDKPTSCAYAGVVGYTVGKGASWAYGSSIVAGRVMDCLCCPSSAAGPRWDP
jgi:hypothetical protein